MIHYTEKKRSPLCHLITNFNSARQRKVARFDLFGVAVSGLMAMTLVGIVRLLVSH